MRSITALLLLFCLPLHAALTVVADLGGESAAPWYDVISPQPEEPLTPVPVKPIDENHWLPVTSYALSPGPVISRKVDLPGMPPLFLVGDDPRSQQWLDARRQQLLALQASGIVVSVRDAVALNALRSHTPGVMMAAEPGDDLAGRLHLSHYPVLITATQISQ